MTKSTKGITKADWQPYPLTKPENGKHYLVVTENRKGNRYVLIDFYSLIDDCWGSAINCEKVIYWAYPPSFPLEKFEVWSEGYRATGHQSGATLHGTYEAQGFEQACFLCFSKMGEETQKYYDAENNTFWACRLFDNEKDARESFG